MSLLKNLFCFIIFYSFLIFASYGNSSEFDEELFPSKDCLSKIILDDEPINAKDCLISGDKIDGIFEPNIFGDPTIKMDFEGDNGAFFLVTYYGKKFSGARPHWVLTIDYSTGGTGLYSVFMVLLQTRDDNIQKFYVENRGDRCADGLANVVSVSSDERLSATTTRRATLFRLFNPSDDTNWWIERNITVFEGLRDEEVRIYFNEISKSPLFENLIPFIDINHCFNCCAGHVLYEQSIASEPLSNGEYLNIVGVIFNMEEISKFVKSEDIDGCLSKSLVDNVHVFDNYSENQKLKYLDISKWSNLKKDITQQCFN